MTPAFRTAAARAASTAARAFRCPPAAPTYIDQNGHVFNPNAPNDPAHPYTGPLGGGSGFKINPDGSLGFNDPAAHLPAGAARALLVVRLRVTSSCRTRSRCSRSCNFSENYTVAKGFTSSVFNVWSPTVPYNHLSDDPASPQFGVLQPGQTGLHPVPAEVAALLNHAHRPRTAPWTYAGGMDYLGNFETDTTSDIYQIVGGLRNTSLLPPRRRRLAPS